jgi:Tfp pilus assembly protein PilO
MTPNSKFYSRYFTYIKPISRIPVVKTYGSAIFSLLIITFFIFYAIKPTIETILVLQKKLDDSNLVLEQVNQKAKDLSLAKQNYDKINPNLKTKMQTLIPDTATLRSLTDSLEQSAKAHQASISALQIQPLVLEIKPVDKLGTIAPIDFSFNVEGSYENLLAILQDLRTSSRLLSVEDLSITSSEESILIMSISGKAYYIK